MCERESIVVTPEITELAATELMAWFADSDYPLDRSLALVIADDILRVCAAGNLVQHE